MKGRISPLCAPLFEHQECPTSQLKQQDRSRKRSECR